MKQVPVVSSTGMFSRFNVTRVYRTVELDYGQIMRAFDTLRSDAVHEMESIALVEKTQQKVRGRLKQVNILKAVLISNTYYEVQKALNTGVIPLISEVHTVDDFFLPEDRFTKVLAKLAPKQQRIEGSYTIGVGGVITLGVPFEEATLSASLTPTSVDGDAGTVTYPLINVGDTVTLSYVTKALYPTILIRRQAKQPTSLNLFIQDEIQAVVMSPALATLLGITLPAY